MMLAVLGMVLLIDRSTRADVTVPAVFSDHMVLQSGVAVPVFGRAMPGEEVSVEINGQKKTTTAGKDGNWLLRLDPLPSGGPVELTISGKNTTTVKDILVGEVWLASGQSNMRFPLDRTTGGKDDFVNVFTRDGG